MNQFAHEKVVFDALSIKIKVQTIQVKYKKIAQIDKRETLLATLDLEQ